MVMKMLTLRRHQAKRARGDDPKRSRLQRITQEYASRISTVEFGNEKFHTMDNYENDQDMKQQDDSADLWADEDSLHFKDVPENLWIFFFRPTPSWLSPGRSTCSIACRKRIN